MVCKWMAGKTVRSPCYHGPYLSTLAMGLTHNRVLYKCPNGVPNGTFICGIIQQFVCNYVLQFIICKPMFVFAVT